MSYSRLQKIWPMAFSITAHALVLGWAVSAYTPPKPVKEHTEPITVRLIELQPHKTTQTNTPPVSKPVSKPAPTVVKTIVAAPAAAPAVDSTPAVAEPINTQVAHAVVAQPVKAVEEFIPPSFSAEYLHNPIPEYPPLARRRGEQGRVLLRVTVSATGEAAVVAVSESSGYELLDQSALRAVKTWRFVPAKFNNHAVVAEVTVPVRFTLES